MIKQLPGRPDLGQLKKQAKDLLDEIRAANAMALARAEIKTGDTVAIDAFALHSAQRVIAREHGFASWSKLKLHVETRAVEGAAARLIEAALEGEQEAVDTILRERPELATRSIFSAAALGDESTIRREVQRTPAAAVAKGGPRDWEPLLYLCFGRCGGSDAARAVAASALLPLGANANATWLHVDWPEAPLPALYGATGVNNYPRLARGLLEAGANPNDGESIYHAAEHNHVACLDVLREFGADFSGRNRTFGSTPLCFLLGYADATPTVRAGIRWLLEHGADPNTRALVQTINQTALHAAVANGWDAEMVVLLLRHGADAALMRADGRTAYALAVRSGREDVAALLRERGAAMELGARDVFLGACMRADASAAQQVLGAHPGLLATLSMEDRKLPIRAAKKGLAGALELFGRFGLHLAVEGEFGEQPLHWAAWHGQVDAVRVLVAGGVPLAPRDRKFCAPPLGWCGHGSLHCQNPAGEYGSVAEALLAAGAAIDGTEGNAAVMAAIRRYRK
ncbi:MAG: ankyrin repeat domain-containing protein [Opitutaceae bacterium]